VNKEKKVKFFQAFYFIVEFDQEIDELFIFSPFTLEKVRTCRNAGFGKADQRFQT
jgi:hypothetical protein